ncbi:hypothetical protein DFH09DRAFT_1088473 [Mycena vulgaris]|nr:hypothetical protein DFH09DRAFT_1088473 [Mycena vulgaris]
MAVAKQAHHTVPRNNFYPQGADRSHFILIPFPPVQMDDWFSVFRDIRSGRSDAGYTFSREAMGVAVRTQRPFSLGESLLRQHKITIHLEDNDPVYRGNVPPSRSCAPALGRPLSHDSDPETDSESDELSDSDSGGDAPVPVERLSSPHTPHRPRLITYSKRDKQRAEALKSLRTEQLATEHARKAAAKKRAAKRAIQEAAERATRRSRRLRRGRVGDSTDAGVYRTQALMRIGYAVHTLPNDLPRPIIDNHDYVMAVIAGAPKDQMAWWAELNTAALQDLRRLARNGDFTHLGEGESHVRFGIGFGEEYAAPHQIVNTAANDHEVRLIKLSESFQVFSAYQNHLYEQFAPRGYALAATTVGELVKRHIAYPSFAHSVFTTSKVSLSDGSSAQKNKEATYHLMEAVTVLGTYDHTARGHLISWDDKTMVEVRPGTTLLIPGGTKHFSFATIAPRETRFFFRQYCNAGVMRWVDKGGRSDTEWEQFMSVEELVAWKNRREGLGVNGLKSFSKMHEIFV